MRLRACRSFPREILCSHTDLWEIWLTDRKDRVRIYGYSCLVEAACAGCYHWRDPLPETIVDSGEKCDVSSTHREIRNGKRLVSVTADCYFMAELDRRYADVSSNCIIRWDIQNDWKLSFFLFLFSWDSLFHALETYRRYRLKELCRDKQFWNKFRHSNRDPCCV